MNRLLYLVLSLVLLLASCACSLSEDTCLWMRGSVLAITDNTCNSRGTAFITEVNGDRVIMTAKHIVDCRLDLKTTALANLLGNRINASIDVTDGNSNIYNCSILSWTDEHDVYKYPEDDWVILDCPAELKDLPALKLAESEPFVGEIVFWAGYPDSDCGAVVEETRTGDWISNHYQRRLSSICGPGSSGSPVYDVSLGLVGIITMHTSETGHGIMLNIPFVKEKIEAEYIRDMQGRF